MKRLILLILMTAFLPLYLWGETSAEEIIRNTGARMIWDPYLKSGSFSRQNRMVNFQVGTSFYLYDGSVRPGKAPHMENFQVIFQEEDYRDIVDFLMEIPERASNSSGYRVTVIVLDPGHGGRDPGAYATYEVDGINTLLREKNINLDVGLRTAEILRQRFPDKEIVMTRSDDRTVELTERVNIAESYHFSPQEGMVFLAIHTNASMNTRGNGFEVWYLPDDFNRDLSDESGELQQVLNVMWEEEFRREGYNLARFILDSMDEQNGDQMPNRGLKQNAWYMLTNQNMASCLIELAFLTNPEDAARLRDTDFLTRSSIALADGITDFIHYFENR